jgi:hypothetical protein
MASAKGRGGAALTALPAPVEPAPAPAPITQPAPDAAAVFRQTAQEHALNALEMLAWLMANANSEAVRVSAANALIDRAHGRAAQAVRVDGEASGEDGQVSLTFTWLDPAKS